MHALSTLVFIETSFILAGLFAKLLRFPLLPEIGIFNISFIYDVESHSLSKIHLQMLEIMGQGLPSCKGLK